jgi:hypothetical protein
MPSASRLGPAFPIFHERIPKHLTVSDILYSFFLSENRKIKPFHSRKPMVYKNPLIGYTAENINGTQKKNG